MIRGELDEERQLADYERLIDFNKDDALKDLGEVKEFLEIIQKTIILSVGQGDSVKFFKNVWQSKTIEEIHQEILRTKKKI